MDEPIRVLCVFGKLNRGGSETMCMNLYRRIDRNKVQFDFVKHSEEKCAYEDEIKALGGKIYTAPRYKMFNKGSYVKWWRKHLESHPEHKIVHGHLFTTASVYLAVCKEYGRITICHSHIAKPYSYGLKDRLKVSLGNNITNVTDYEFACSKLAGDYLFKNEDYIVLNNAIDTEIFVYDRHKAKDMRNKLGISEKTLVIGTVGRLMAQKNPDKIIEILSSMKKREEDFKFIWIGEGELEGHIRERLEATKLTENVLMLGSRSDVNELLMAMDVFLLPSLYEGLPVSVIEAQASGLPCVISDSITKEVDITSLIKFLPLDTDPDNWCDSIKESATIERADTRQKIIDAGYDVENSSAWLCDFYLKALKQSNRMA